MITDELVDQALKIVAEGAGNYQYFFANLNSPDWIAPLQRKGRFSNPPQAEARGNSIRFPSWPEGEYLLRMAPISPQAVFDAIDEKCYKSDNHVVHELLLRIATELPTAYAGRIAEAEAEWASQQPGFYGLYSHRAGPLIVKLARGGRSDSALSLLDPILEVHAPEETRAKREIIVEDRPVRLSVDPVGRIAAWDIQHLLAAVGKTLADTDPAGILALLSRRLHQAIQIHGNERGNDNDYSTIWRPQIAAGHLGRVLDVLVTAVRDVALAISQGSGGGYKAVVAVFEKQRWPIFQRLKYYALSETEVLPEEFVSSLLAKDALYQSTTANPEFNQFLSKWAPKVPEKTRAAVLAIIDAGPDVSKYSRYLDRQEKEGKRQEAEQWITERWRLGWLTALQDVLDERHRAELTTLTEKYGPPRPAFWAGGFFAGDRSEMNLDEMRKLSIPALITYLRTWEPNPQWGPDTPNRAGLGQTLQQWATEDPALFSENLRFFEDLGLHPTYLRSLIDSFTATLKSDRSFDVYAVTRTVEWLLRNTTGSPSQNHDWDEDPGWSWGHMSCARFLAELFLHPQRLHTSRRRELWPALELIAENPSPSPDDEKEYVKGSDFGLLALNSTRSVGLEAVVQYARWIKASESGIRADSEGLPEVFALLAKHLDGTADQSIAVREMYGMQFRILAWLDRAWLERQLPALFPEEPFRVLDRFAWNSYLRFSRPIADLLPAMRFRYERAINALQAHANVVDDSERALGGHLIGYYASGAIALGDPLLASFFLKASPRLRAQTIGDIGWHLREEQSGNLSSVAQERLVTLWESRFASASQKHVSEARQELASFGWWLSSKKFADAWAIQQAVSVLDTFRKLDPDFAVVERLAELASAYPFEAVHCLGLIFEEDRDGWAIHGWGENPQIIIREALRDHERGREEATRVLNIFISRGHNGFRSLLRVPETLP